MPQASESSSLRLTMILLGVCVALALLLLAVVEAVGAEGAPTVDATAATAGAGGQDPLTEWAPVEKAMGKAGSMQPGEVFRVNMPRTDLKVAIAGVTLEPALALGSWVAFKNADGAAMAMGDLVLTEEEVAPVMRTLEEGGIEVTGFHNHLLGELPRVMYLHINGRGDAVKLAEAIRAAIVLTGTPLGATGAVGGEMGLDTARLDGIIGYTGKASGKVYQYGIPRAQGVTQDGMEVPPAMGTAIAVNFQSAGGGKAATTGDFVLTADEVNPVAAALLANGIEVTAIHNHMLTEQPRLFFLHFWAVDEETRLARGLRAALDKVNVKAPSAAVAKK